MVEIAVPEVEIVHVVAGQEVELTFEAEPSQSLRGSLRGVHPRAELREASNVFVAEVVLANSNGGLRPGMKGHARIATSRQSLGWIWFHKPWNWLQSWLR